MDNATLSLELLNENNLSYFDPNPSANQEYIRSVVEHIMLDVSHLLNTRPTYDIESGPLKNFIINYGLKNLTYFSPYSQDDQNNAAKMIKECITLFEPRLHEVIVTPRVYEDDYDANFCFQIKAVIKFSETQVPILLESKIKANSNTIQLKLNKHYE